LRSLLQAYRTVLLHAQSGAGKSSLVNAGLLPALKAEGVSWTRGRVGGAAMEGAKLPPGRNIFVTALLTSGFGFQLDRCPSLLGAFRLLDDDAEHVLVLDQLEELFTRHLDRWADREPFFEQISELLERKTRLRILFVIRDEFVSRLDQYAHYTAEEFQIRLFLERLRTNQAKDAVRGPFQTAGIEFESEAMLDGFVAALKKQLLQTEGGNGKKPLTLNYVGEFVEPVHLQVVCRALAAGVEGAGATRIGSREIEAYGNPDRSLIHFYEDVLARVARGRHIGSGKLRRWFGETMITAGGTRSTVFMGSQATDHLIRSEPRAGATWYEITHDCLIAPIQQSNKIWSRRRVRRVWASAVAAGLVLLQS
jgi:hypothetical protein